MKIRAVHKRTYKKVASLVEDIGKNSFAYEKLLQILIQQIIEPSEAIVLGGTWRIPVLEGLLDKTFVDELKLDDTYSDSSFAREYESQWSGDAENAYFSSEKFDKCRVLQQPELKYSARGNKLCYYVLGVDVGRKGCTTEITIIKVTPQPQGSSIKALVNLVTIEDEHFENQAIAIKKLYYTYKADRIAIDANGLGIGLVDYLVKPSLDPETNETLPGFGVDNDEEGFYKKYRDANTVQDALFLIKANAPINTEIYSYIQTQLNNGKLKFLVDEVQAKGKLLTTKVGLALDTNGRNEYLKPFTLTTILKDQMLNLTEENEGLNIILKQSSKNIKKDKFSAFGYGLYYLKKEEESKRRRRSHKLSDFMFFT